ncbi:hypothetical protein D1007_52270 [Hordeum vulgare]|nr:hypothetical protein D1007_52270 [Hordeum vulgare]
MRCSSTRRSTRGSRCIPAGPSSQSSTLTVSFWRTIAMCDITIGMYICSLPFLLQILLFNVEEFLLSYTQCELFCERSVLYSNIFINLACSEFLRAMEHVAVTGIRFYQVEGEIHWFCLLLNRYVAPAAHCS